MQYDPVNNEFVVFETNKIPEEKVELNLPLFDSPIDMSRYDRRVTSDGVPITKRENPMIVNHNQDSSESSQQLQQIDESFTPTSLNDRQKAAMSFFKNKGLSGIHAAGIVANLMGESNLDHTAVNPTSKAYGLAQWLGPRKTKLFNKYGKNPTFNQQLEFVWEELNSNEKGAFDKLLKTKTYNEATNSFMKWFERPSAREQAQSISRRLSFAKNLFYNEKNT